MYESLLCSLTLFIHDITENSAAQKNRMASVVIMTVAKRAAMRRIESARLKKILE